MEESKPNPVNDIPPQNPIPNSDPLPNFNPPEKPSPTISQEPPPPPPPPPPSVSEPAPMPPPPSTAPVTMPHPPATAPASVPPPPPPPPAPAAAPPPPRTNKRPLDGNAQIQDSSYFKVRAVLKDMRPHLLEVIGTVDFRNCKAADELQEKLKLLKQLYEQMSASAVTITKCKIEPEDQKLASENGDAQKLEHLEDNENAASDVKEAIDLEVHSSYIGGSAFGWNFVTFSGNKAIYYGRSKESYRASQAALPSAMPSPS